MNDFHSLKIEATLKKLNTSKEGISEIEAEKRIKKYGFNELPKEKELTKLNIFISQFNNALIIILIIAGVLSFILGEYIDSGVIFGAVVLNVIIGFFQENKANNSITKLKNLVEHKALVLREGQEKIIDSKDVVIGDIIVIEAGNKIPADARLIVASDLQVNEASLTGESIPSNKHISEVKKGSALADRENMVYAGTMAVHGLGQAVVAEIGKNTELGKIAELVKGAKEEETPLQIRLKKFGRTVGAIFGVICLVVVVVGMARGRDFLEMFETGVAVGVASIPEGLTVAVTFILALGMQQILKKRALTRKLIATETLGSTTVICTDKTGTLTEGNMHVSHIVVGTKEFEMDNMGSRQDEKEAKISSLTLQAAMMCNDAVVENPKDELASWEIIGSPTETALLSAAIQSGLRKEELLKMEPRIGELPFDSEKKFMISLHQKDDKNFILYEKGAPERLLEKSSHYYHLGKLKLISEEDKKNLSSTYEQLTNRGLRVIGLSYKKIKQPKEEIISEKEEISWDLIDKDLIFLGFIAIKDPLRKEAKETIGLCKKAGIRPIIITGDHKLTAKAIAGEVGLDVKAENIITGEELEKINDDNLRKMIKNIDVYARVSPHHKLRIVKMLQSSGEVVAMTGDGINDSPALKAADIGVSLGDATDIAKETSDIVLLDNNFKTIVEAVKQGRIIFKNIRKVITYLISDSFSEMILIVGSILFNTPLALLPAQILWINIINDGLPDFSLAFEKGDDTVMKEKPIRKDEPLFNKEMKILIFVVGIIRDILIFLLFYYLWRQWRFDPEKVSYLITLIFAIVGMKSLLGIFSLRSFRKPIWSYNPFSNKYLVGAVSASMLLLILGVHWSPLQMVLSTVDLDFKAWLTVIMVSIFSVALIEIAKINFYIKVESKNKS